MIDGTLTIDFEPAFMGFSTKDASPDRKLSQYVRRDCSLADIREFLIELDVISPNQSWPPADLILRLPIKLPISMLEKLELAQSSSVRTDHLFLPG